MVLLARSKRHLQFCLLGVTLLNYPLAARAFVLPYTTRTRDFSSWTAAAQGDTNTIGMAGATVGLPTSISSAQNNPAGYAMTMGPISAQINSTSYNDERLQRTGETIKGSQWGLAIGPATWGFSVAYFSPQTETGTYVAPAIGDTANTEVSLKELRLTAARRFFNHALSVGATFEVAKAVREINENSSNNYGLTYQLGVLYRNRNHVVLGLSFSPELRVGPASSPDVQNAIPGFNRDVVRPSLSTVGLGWMPNRFFKLGLSVTYAGRTENTALLYDQSILSGNRGTWVPRFGVSYVLAEFSNFKVEGAAGTYYEFSRLNTFNDRLHATLGIEVNPSFINLGAGFDVAPGFSNFLVAAGVDIVRIARFFNIVPPENGKPYNGFLPRIKLASAGLPAGLVADDRKVDTAEADNLSNVGKIISDVPGNLAKKFEGEKTTDEEQGAPEPSLKGMVPDFSKRRFDQDNPAEDKPKSNNDKKKKGARKATPKRHKLPPQVHGI